MDLKASSHGEALQR